MDRRQLLIGAGALAAGAATRILPTQAQAKPSQMVLMTWGGLWGDSMKEGCDTAFEKLTGVKIIQDRGSSPGERITKIKVAADDQKFDIVQLHDGIVPLAVSQGVLEPINRNSPRLTNLKNVPDRFVQSHWIAMIYSPLGIIYNTKLVKNPPTSFADLWRPEFKGRIVLPEISHSIGPYIIPIGSIAAGKGPNDAEAGFEMLKKMTVQQPIWAKDTDTHHERTAQRGGGDRPALQIADVHGQGLERSGRVGLSDGRRDPLLVRHRHRQGHARTWSWPRNSSTSRSIQKCRRWWRRSSTIPAPTPTTEAGLSAELQARVKATPEEMSRLIDLDHATMAAKRAEWTDRWNRIVSAG